MLLSLYIHNELRLNLTMGRGKKKKWIYRKVYGLRVDCRRVRNQLSSSKMCKSHEFDPKAALKMFFLLNTDNVKWLSVKSAHTHEIMLKSLPRAHECQSRSGTLALACKLTSVATSQLSTLPVASIRCQQPGAEEFLSLPPTDAIGCNARRPTHVPKLAHCAASARGTVLKS